MSGHSPATGATPVVLRPGRPLTAMQRGLWASQRRNPDAPVQNLALVSHIDGFVDPERFVAAFDRVASASDALRSRIVDTDTARVILSDPPRTVVVDLALGDVDAWASTRARRPIDMSVSGVDSVLLRHPDRSATWYLSMHHTVTDAASRAAVFDATGAAYLGEPVESPSYYEWARAAERSAHPKVAKARRYWRDRPGADRPDQLYRPVRRPTPDSARVPVPLDGGLGDRLAAALAGDLRVLSEDLSWTVLLVTAVALQVHALSGAPAFSIGMPVHNRTDPTTRAIIGPLMEVYPVDVEIDPDDTLAVLHRRIGRSVMQTLRHASPGTAPTPDFDVLVNVIPSHGLGDFAGIPTRSRWVDTDATDPSNLLRVQLTGYGDDGPELSLDLNHAAAAPVHRRRAGRHHRRIIEALVDDPDRRVADLDIVLDEEVDIWRRWGHDPVAGDDRPRAAPAAITETIRSAIADLDDVVCEDGDRTWTGRALWRAVVEIAAALRTAGVGAGDRVGIEMPRCAEAVAAIVATLVAGASYVPLDPRQPELRRMRLVERAGCRMVLRVTDVAGPLARPAQDPAAVDPPALDPPALDREAYLLFTSGSTGEPKGVPITHLGLADYMATAVAHYAGVEPPVVPLFSALTFDLTVTSLFLPLVTGGRLVVIGEEGPAALSLLASRRDLTWAKATPSHLELVVRDLPADHGLRTLIVGGEAFPAGLARRLSDRLPMLSIIDEYGPTEAVVGCMIHHVDPTRFPDEPDVPIGVPAPGVSLRVRDAAMRPVPVGAPGELWISHRGVTAGYLDADHDLDRFVEADGRRWYRSGDRVRLLDDEATLAFLGRADEQLKVGGIRLDPAEVEAAVEVHPAIERAVVRAWSPTVARAERHCVRCGLPSNVPGVHFDHDQVCSTCHAFDAVTEHAADYFGTPDDLLAIRDRARSQRTGRYDCLHLLSGGKDSTYALYRLVELGFEVFALTLDNGFISEGAKANVSRSVADLGIDHEFVTTDAMAEVFRDSLERHSNVCHGCYKTIYTLGTTRAVELGIPVIVTGLSRGQLFETRLVPQQFRADRFDADAIDAAVVEARKVYHRADDAVRRTLDVSVFDDDDIFERVRYVDFYRYEDVELAHMLDFLERRAPWVRPADTGRSTNCLINAAGIATHVFEQGYHNYAEPYAWDVRLGHKTRDEAMAELDDPHDPAAVAVMLDEVGYRPRPRSILTAWMQLVPDAEAPSPAALRAFLADRLPTHAIPAAFVTLPEIPTTSNGKLDTGALPRPDRVHRPGSALHVAPESALERSIVSIWERRLGVEPIGIDDDFFDLGGDSLAALEMAMSVAAHLGAPVAESAVFTHTTPRALAAFLDTVSTAEPAPTKSGSGGPHAGHGDAGGAGVGPLEAALLVADAAAPEANAFTVVHRYEIAAEVAVDVGAIARAIESVVARHRSLTTTYREPRSTLSPTLAVPVDVDPVPAPRADVERGVAALAQTALDPRHGPIGRAMVRRVDDGATVVVLAVHHVAVDAASFDVLWREIELAAVGRALPPASDHAPPTPLDDDDPARGRWRTRVAALTGGVLATAKPPTPEPDGYLRRPATTSAAELRSGVGRTPFATAMAALAATLERWGGVGRAEFALSASTRRAGDADAVGYHLNLLPVGVDIDEGQTWAELGRRTGLILSEALADRHVPFADIVADARAAGRVVPQPSIILSYEQFEPARFEGHAVRHDVVPNGVAVTDATFFVQVDGPDVHLALEYRGSMLGAATAGQLLDDLDAALVAATRAGGVEVDTLALPSTVGAVRRGPVPEVADPDDVVVRIDRCLAAGAGGVVCGDEHRSGVALDRRVQGIVGRLADAGVGAGDRVAVCLPRGVDLIAAIVAVLRRGAAVVPVDPEHPADRIATLLDDGADAAAVVVDASTRGLVGTSPGPRRLVDLATPGSAIDDPAPIDPDPDAVAYVIFTSGSTGTPQPVEVTRRQLAFTTSVRDQVYPVSPDSFLLTSSVAFDSSVAGIYWTLTTGGTLVLPTAAQAHDIDALVALVDRHGISHVLMVPSLYQALVERGRGIDSWPTQVIVAGEACPPALAAAHFDHRPSSRLANEYGPTEATVWATVHHGAPGDDPVPIGGPIPGTDVAIVDERGRLRPRGVPGELIVAGPGVTDGTNRPDRFRSRRALDGRIAYATGDLVVDTDAGLVFVGRVDHQLNVGGVRLEPEDIEQAIGTLRAVSSVVVVAADPRPLDELVAVSDTPTLSEAMRAAAATPEPATALRSLLAAGSGPDVVVVAHVEPVAGLSQAEQHAIPHAVREVVRRGFPGPAVPAAVVLHDRLPRTPNGKVDRAGAARLAVAADRVRGADVGRPTTEPDRLGAEADEHLTRALALFAAAVPGTGGDPDVGFFSAGGDSLRALRLADAIEEHTGEAVPLAEIVADLTPRALAARLAASGGIERPAPLRGAARRDGAGPVRLGLREHPLSASQQRMWIHGQLHADTIPYLLSTEIDIRGAVDDDLLAAALAAVVARHPSLRTRIVSRDGTLVAVVDDPPDAIAPTAIGPDTRGTWLQATFALDTDWPIRFAIVRRGSGRAGDTHTTLSIAAHHIAVDGRSLQIIVDDIVDAYDALVGGPARATEPALAYADVAHWASAVDDPAHLRRRLDHWRAVLAGSERLEVPGRRASPEPTGSVRTVAVPLAERTGRALVEMGAAHATAPFPVLVALTQAWLARLTGCEDVAVGTPVGERRAAELDDVVGPFVNLAVLRGYPDHGASFGDLVVATRAVVADAVEHADVAFDAVVRALSPDRSRAGLPFVDVMCSMFEPGDIRPRRAGGLTWQRRDDDTWVGGLLTSLLVEARVDDDELGIVLRFDPGVLDVDVVDAIASALGVLADSVAARPDLPLHAHALVPGPVAEALLTDPPTGDVDRLALRLDEQVAIVASARPHAVAVRDDERTLDYGRLLAEADDLATRLAAAGIGPGRSVAVAIDRSVELVIAMVGILRAGAAYVPLDNAAPTIRRTRMIETAGASALVTRSSPGAPFGSSRGDRTFSIELSLLPRTPGEAFALDPSVACVMFTSGSTGEPKGAMVTHRGIQRLVTDADYAALDDDTVMGMAANPAFDACTFEMWGALCNGGRLEVLTTDDVLDPDRFAGAIGDRGITTMVLPTSLFDLVSRRRPDAFASMRDLLVGGEALDPASVRRVWAHRPARLVNAYGPTECAVIAAAHEVDQLHPDASTVPIGRAIIGTSIDIVDRHGHLQPTGVDGELVIGGDAVGLGYLGDPELTAARFAMSSHRPGVRVYRTGDIARRRVDGRIEFVGRRDGQIKLRGHRIETAEVERVLTGTDGVAAAVVHLVTGAAGRRLVAHVVTDPAASATVVAEAARRRCGEHLPPVMVPAAVYVVDEFPLTATGKLDRAALAADATARSAPDPIVPGRAGAGSGTARGALDEMRSLWAQVLGVDHVGPDDDFFDIGGHSLLAVAMIGEIERRHGGRPPLSVLFEARTPRRLVDHLGLADSVRSQPHVGTANPVVVLRAGDAAARTPIWLVHPAGGNHLRYEPLAARLDPLVPVMGVEAPGLRGETPPLRDIDALADHQHRWIVDRQPNGPYRLVGYSVGGIIGIEVARRLRAAGAEVEGLVVVEAGAPGAAPAPEYPSRIRAYRDLIGSGNLGGLRERISTSVRRRLEEAAIAHLGVRPSAERIDEAVRLAMVEAFLAYDGSPVDVGVTLVAGTENESHVVEALTAAWVRLATRGVTVERTRGWHDTVLTAPAVDDLAAIVRRVFARSDA